MPVPLESTGYPTLGVIHHFGVEDPAARRAIWARSAVWADRVRAHNENPTSSFQPELRSIRTFNELERHFGDRVIEVDDAIHQAMRRAVAWCEENKSR